APAFAGATRDVTHCASRRQRSRLALAKAAASALPTGDSARGLAAGNGRAPPRSRSGVRDAPR
ncbi:hypothetical protein, partial [Salmonella enterica]|uniref:hypothetical protein n=1 Tax=Salmonella enterica TaxID=28901 RepID=UPI00359C6362